MSIYCGNNYGDPDVVVGLKRIGTRYQCLKTGIGIGLHLPFDPSYAVPYKPIDRTKIYCGKARRRPNGYHRMGSPALCLRSGVGIGKSIRAKQPRRSPLRRDRSRRRKSRRKSRRRRRKSRRRKSKKKKHRKSHRRKKSRRRKKKSR